MGGVAFSLALGRTIGGGRGPKRGGFTVPVCVCVCDFFWVSKRACFVFVSISENGGSSEKPPEGVGDRLGLFLQVGYKM